MTSDQQHEQRTAKPAPGDWAQHANCLGIDVALFFPPSNYGGDNGLSKNSHKRSAQAKEVCAGCSVRAACLDYAQTEPIDHHGIWGGLTDHERRQVRKGEKIDNPLAPPGFYRKPPFVRDRRRSA